MIMIDKMSYLSRFRHKNPGLKCFFSVSTLLICVVSQSMLTALLSLIIMGSLTIYSGISFSHYIHFLKLPLIFLLMSSAAIIFNISDVPLSFFAVSIGNRYITISIHSLFYGIHLTLTAFASVSCLYFLSLTTPMTDIIYLLKKVHCPFLLIELLLLIYRFIFLLLDLSSALNISRKCRLGNKDFKTSCLSMGALISVLFVRAFKNSSALYDAMESRCYDGILPILEENYSCAQRDWGLVLSVIVILFFVSIIRF